MNLHSPAGARYGAAHSQRRCRGLRRQCRSDGDPLQRRFQTLPRNGYRSGRPELNAPLGGYSPGPLAADAFARRLTRFRRVVGALRRASSRTSRRRRRRSAASASRAGSIWRTPQLTRIGVSQSPTGTGSASTRRASISALARAVGRSACTSSTANSSPPMRPTMSDSRTWLASRLGHRLQHRVAGGVAEAVVDRLEVVEVEVDQAGRRIVALGEGGDPLQFADEGAAVLGRGQRVLVGGRLGLLQPRLQPLRSRRAGRRARSPGVASACRTAGVSSASVTPRNSTWSIAGRRVPTLAPASARLRRRMAANGSALALEIFIARLGLESETGLTAKILGTLGCERKAGAYTPRLS